jgi:DNA-binding NtrC family response regulator
MGPKPRILVVDDEDRIREILCYMLGKSGHEVAPASSGEEALGLLKEKEFDVVLLDIVMPGRGGMEVLKEMREKHPLTEVVLITAHASVETAVESTRSGAYGYVTKPFNFQDLNGVVWKAYEKKKLNKKAAALEHLVERSGFFPDIVGTGPAMKSLADMIEKIAPAETTVLIEGETGTGKELIARNIHNASPRAGMPFLSVNCASLQESLLESELFGHEKGAFTGADKLKRGLLEVSDGGTLFLDEVGEMSLEIQSKFLRVLESGEMRRVGGNTLLKVDLRVITATNRCLQEEVAQGRFRKDLFYRLNAVRLQTPPLRERKEDIPMLVEYFMTKFMGTRPKRVSSEAMRALQQHRWPGNVRELRNTVERLVLLADGDVVEPKHLPPDAFSKSSEPDEEEGLSLAEVERIHIVRVLKKQGGNKKRSAEVLGITRSTLYLKLKEYGIRPGDYNER